MADVYDWLAQQDAPQAKEITIDGVTRTIWVKRLSAGEREKVLRGVKIDTTPGKGGMINLDLGENERQRQLMVLFCICREDGARAFPNLDAVRQLNYKRFEKLARLAEGYEEGQQAPEKKA